MAILASRLRQADEALAASTFLTAKARVALALLELAKLVGKPAGPRCVVLDEKISNGDLAAMAGVARENVSRVLAAAQSGRYRRLPPLPPQRHHRAQKRNRSRCLSRGRWIPA